MFIVTKVYVCRHILLLEFIWSRLSDGALQHLFDFSFDAMRGGCCVHNSVLPYIISNSVCITHFCLISCLFTRHYVLLHRNRCIRAVSYVVQCASTSFPHWSITAWHSGSVFPGLLWLLLTGSVKMQPSVWQLQISVSTLCWSCCAFAWHAYILWLFNLWD